MIQGVKRDHKRAISHCSHPISAPAELEQKAADCRELLEGQLDELKKANDKAFATTAVEVARNEELTRELQVSKKSVTTIEG